MGAGGCQFTGCWCDTISHNLKIAVNLENLPVNPGYRFNKIFIRRSSQQKLPCFIWCVLASCVVILLIQLLLKVTRPSFFGGDTILL